MSRLIMLLLLACLVSACGRRGSLEQPPGAEPAKDEPIVLDKII